MLNGAVGPSKFRSTPYLWALIVFVVGCLVAITIIAIYRDTQDNTALYTQIFGFMTTVVVAMLAFIKSNEGVAITHENKELILETKVEQRATHQLVDGRMTALVDAVRKLAMAQGINIGLEQGIQQEAQRIRDVAEGKAAGVIEGTATGTAAGIVTGTEQAVQRAKEDTQLLKDAKKNDLD